ncbi:uncharacterized protein HMPREF1541_08838 [Cyphellophora europaea CBS 101466]|uniref:Uncharacterized protein n=1 Tax=Cyphellophora europaea (strain CBS 101466) TaxID=1220924 RepID=W2RJN8_CYPE1|nr:uncharacterized protein HMPREF1541_08838 [Cyphellophora europaea CBS 101466]ETN36560.1 hypothetical protein HMPREF1541_08838 [Cyphellophora europaea CBS 101466]
MASNRIPSDSTATSSGADVMEVDLVSNPSSSRRTSLTAPSIHETPQTYTDRLQHIAHLQARLQNLHLDAQRELNLQPKSTQLELGTQTRGIFDAYAKHGSEARLSQSIAAFLGSERNTDTLQIWSTDEAAAASAAAAQKMIQLRILAAARAIKTAKHTTVANEMPGHINTIPDADITDSPLDGRRTTTNDEPTTPLIREWEFAPVDITLSMPNHLDLPPTLLPTVSRILNVYNLQANARLHHHEAKYITLHPTPHKTVHGYALLRLGVSERFAELVGQLFDTEHTNAMGLSQERRAWLRECYEKMGVQGQGLNQREAEMVAGMVGLDVEGVQEWWEEQGRKLRGWKAMRVWIAARELELVRKAKLEGRY